jgi:putative phosphoesterase
MTELGVIADSHIPDRMRALPPAVFDALDGVDAILHAGDVCARRVLTDLERLAPVYAVNGNRDFFMRLPLDRRLTFDGVTIGLTHGHGGWLGYLREKLRYYTVGYHLARHLDLVRARFTDVQAIVFGHSHYPVNRVVDGVLLFNPGSLGPDYRTAYGPAVGRLTIAGGAITGRILPLDPSRDQRPRPVRLQRCK